MLLPNVSSQPGEHHRLLEKLDSEALGKSPIKVPARPWTNVAGDGVVSELISAWFRWDDIFCYPYVDRECFLDDMRKGDPSHARYCSPFLVNALCAQRSVGNLPKLRETVKIMRVS